MVSLGVHSSSLPHSDEKDSSLDRKTFRDEDPEVPPANRLKTKEDISSAKAPRDITLGVKMSDAKSMSTASTPAQGMQLSRSVSSTSTPSRRIDDFIKLNPQSVTRSSTASSFGTNRLVDLLPNNEWRSFLEPILRKEYKNNLINRIETFLNKAEEDAKKGGYRIFPPRANIFQAFFSTPLSKVKVILLGQDPYHQPGQAHGLSFSVAPGTHPPPSLLNMYKELETDIPGFTRPSHGYLMYWAEQGVLLLNATLTVQQSNANSHQKCGWGEFTDGVIQLLSTNHPKRLVFLLWGAFAGKKAELVDKKRHVVLRDCHPSPLSASRGWFGCKCFSRCNEALREIGQEPIDWNLPMHV